MNFKKAYLGFFSIPMILCTILTSCKNDPEGPNLFSGKIVNPHVDYVVLSDFKELQDTVDLNDDGSFKVSYDRLEEGLYTLIHPDEYQSIYIAPSDELTLRLNTRAFDESLAFSGTHAHENQYLIDLFINLETKSQLKWSSYKLGPEAFFKQIKKRNIKLLNKLNEAKEKHDFPEEFVKHAEQAIQLTGWAQLERYAYAHYGKNDFLNFKEVPAYFYSHRSQLDLNDVSLMNNYAFRPFLKAMISHLSFEKEAKKQGSGKDVHKDALSYYQQNLKVIDSIITSQELKDLIATYTTEEFIFINKNAREIKTLMRHYEKMVTSADLKENTLALAAVFMNMEPGKQMHEIQLMNTQQKVVRLSDQVERMSVLFFWSVTESEFAVAIHDRVRELRIKYPEIQFVGINMDNPKDYSWQNANSKYRFDINNEFQIMNTSNVKQRLGLSNRNRVMIIDKNLNIVDPNINLFKYDIETTLLGYLNP